MTSQTKKLTGDKKEKALHYYKLMLTARILDERSILLYKQNKSHFQIGCQGHEAVQVAAGSVFRSGIDWSFPYYRDLPYCISLGMTPKEVLLNILHKADDPNSHGIMMPMHFCHKQLRIQPQSSPTGTQFLQAVGVAHGIKFKGEKEVVYCSSGEGACSEGDFHEAMSWASRERLPIIFLVQNNGYAISVPVEEEMGSHGIYGLAAGYYDIERYEIDGTDFLECKKIFKKAHARAVKGEGPSIIEAYVPRLSSHSISDDQTKYREKEDIENDKKHCPIKRYEKELIQAGVLEKELEEIREKIKSEIAALSSECENAKDPVPEVALIHSINQHCLSLNTAEITPVGDPVFLVDSIRQTLDEELAASDKTLVFGQDVGGGKGGVFTATLGLSKKYGKSRVFNTPIAESAIAGVSIGLSLYGLKPIAEIQFGDYVWPAMMQIRNEAAMMRYRTQGEFSCPLVLRIPVGGYINGACYHSQNIEATFSHFPGLLIAYPSNATDAAGLLRSAIRGDNPVLFLEHKGLYRQVYAKGAITNSLVPFGKAKIVKQGSDITIVTWGALVQKSLQVAEKLSEQDISIEVIDLRTIVPLDKETIFNSVKKTSRCVIAHEDSTFMGFGAEISAAICNECFSYLDAPIGRVGMKDVAAVPQAPVLEKFVLPQIEDIEQEVFRVLRF